MMAVICRGVIMEARRGVVRDIAIRIPFYLQPLKETAPMFSVLEILWSAEQ